MTTQEEKALVARAQKGEMSAFEDLVTAYERRVFVLAYRSSNNEEDARDITQEVFLRVYRSLHRFRGDSSFSTWIYRVTMNICVDFARKNAAGPQTITILDDEEQEKPIPDTNITHQPEAAFENTVLREEIQLALAGLSQEHRSIVLMRDVAGLSYEEVGKAVGINVGTVKSRLARARKNLRDILCQSGNLTICDTSKQTERRME